MKNGEWMILTFKNIYNKKINYNLKIWYSKFNKITSKLNIGRYKVIYLIKTSKLMTWKMVNGVMYRFILNFDERFNFLRCNFFIINLLQIKKIVF